MCNFYAAIIYQEHNHYVLQTRNDNNLKKKLKPNKKTHVPQEFWKVFSE